MTHVTALSKWTFRSVCMYINIHMHAPISIHTYFVNIISRSNIWNLCVKVLGWSPEFQQSIFILKYSRELLYYKIGAEIIILRKYYFEIRQWNYYFKWAETLLVWNRQCHHYFEVCTEINDHVEVGTETDHYFEIGAEVNIILLKSKLKSTTMLK
jgi:hypothetical protein